MEIVLVLTSVMAHEALHRPDVVARYQQIGGPAACWDVWPVVCSAILGVAAVGGQLAGG